MVELITWFSSFFAALKTFYLKVVICKSISVVFGILNELL